MAFSKKDKSDDGGNVFKTPAWSMSLAELDVELQRLARLLAFSRAETSPRTSKNYSYLMRWADMDIDQFREQVELAKKAGKTIEVYSGAYTDDGAIRMPQDDGANYIQPTLAEIITLLRERNARVNFAKAQSDKEWDMPNTNSLTEKLSTA